MKSTTPIIVFYILYFVWLFSVTYLTRESRTLNYFSIGVVLFYMLVLREKGDLTWFLVASCVPVLMTAISVKNFSPTFSPDLIQYMPLWLPLAWGTTVVALRKFYKVVTEE